MRRYRALLPGLLCFWCGAIAAQADGPVEQRTLPCGLSLVTQQRPACGTFALTLVALGGRAEDPSDQTGLSEVLAGMLLRGSDRRTADVQAHEVERAGATLDAQAGVLGIALRAAGPSAALDSALDVMLDAALHPKLRAEDLAAEIALARQRLMRALDVASTERDRLTRTVMFGDHPLGRIAEPASYLTTLDIDAIRRAHAGRFTGRRLILIAVGEIDAARLAERVAAAMEPLPPGEAPPVALPGPRRLATEVRARARRRTTQPELMVGMPTPGLADEEEPAMDLLVQILCGFEERLSGEIREKRGWAYWLSPLDWRYPGAGAFGVITAVPRRRLRETEAIVRSELRRIAAGAPSPEEIDRARRYLLTALARTWQRSDGRAAILAAGLTRGRPARDYDAIASRYARVTPEEIRDLAARLFGQSHLAVVTVY